jgi:hypothetical protein
MTEGTQGNITDLSDVYHWMQITTGSGLWLKANHAPLPVRWVVIRDPLGKFKPQALVCTDVRAQATQILLWFVQRWQWTKPRTYVLHSP